MSNPSAITITAPPSNSPRHPVAATNSTITFTDNSTPSSLGNRYTGYIWNFGDNQAPRTSPPTLHPSIRRYRPLHRNRGRSRQRQAARPRHQKRCRTDHLAPGIFVMPDSFYCPNTLATFTDLSEGYGLTYSWNFGDGTGPGSLTAQNPQHAFPAATGVTYPVTETITDEYGCTADTTENIKIEAPLPPLPSPIQPAICIPLQTMFNPPANTTIPCTGNSATAKLRLWPPARSHFYNDAGHFHRHPRRPRPRRLSRFHQPKVFLTNPIHHGLQLHPKNGLRLRRCPVQHRSAALYHLHPGIRRQHRRLITERSSHPYLPKSQYLLTRSSIDRCHRLLRYHIRYVGDCSRCRAILHRIPGRFLRYRDRYLQSITRSPTTASRARTTTSTTAQARPNQPPLTNPFDTTHYFNTPGNLLVNPKRRDPSQLHCELYRYDPHLPDAAGAIADSGYLCAGLVQFLGKLAVPDVDTLSWKWRFWQRTDFRRPEPTRARSLPEPIPVTLEASISFGCADTTSTSMTINPDPTIKGPKEITTPVGVPVTIPFTYSPDVTTWAWTPAANLSCTDCPIRRLP